MNSEVRDLRKYICKHCFHPDDRHGEIEGVFFDFPCYDCECPNYEGMEVVDSE